MNFINKWVRRIHRWLVIPLTFAIILLIIGSMRQGEAFKTPGWLGLLGILSILLLVITGVYMFAQHYWSRWWRVKQRVHAATNG